MASNSPPITDIGSNGGQRHPRVNKPDMFMNVALWMELSPLAECPDNFGGISHTTAPDDGLRDGTISSSTRGNVVKQDSNAESKNERPTTPQKVHKSGAVVVLPNDRALSVDCSQAGVHAAVSALNKFGQERVKGCQVYLSRRPCSFCAKLLVQCELAKVFYLPIEPEWNDEHDVHRVDNIFKASSTGLQIFIPRIGQNVLDEVTKTRSPFSKNGKADITDFRRALEEEYWSDEWIQQASQVLKWPAFSTEKMRVQTIKDLRNLMEWIARATKGDVPDRIKFAEIDPETMQSKKEKKAGGDSSSSETTTNGHSSVEILSIPTPSEDSWQLHAIHMCRMAQMLSQRSDDPTNRVGCSLMLDNEVVAIGWNGFPAKSLFGEFPHGSSSNQTGDRKEHFVIHAEQNALLTRNKRNLKYASSILFSNKVPAPECVPLLIAAGVKNVVIPQEPADSPENRPFFQAIKSVKLKGFWPTEEREATASRQLRFGVNNLC